MKIWMSNRRTLLGLLLSSASTLPSIAFAQPQPQTLEIILPFGAGSNIEKLLKTTAPVLEKELGRPIQIKLVPGDGGEIGRAHV